MADVLPLLGCCPLCHTVVPMARNDGHVEWHAGQGEQAPSLTPLVEE
jgi:hypothetical protein